MATSTAAWTTDEIKAAKAARRVYPEDTKADIATRVVKAGKLGRGRPPTGLGGLARFAKVLRGRSAASIASKM